MRRAALVLAAMAVACQPAGGPAAVSPTQGTDGPRLGAPDVGGVPQTLTDVLREAQPRAQRWQDEPVLAEVTIDVDDGGRWSATEAVFVAGDADRLLTVRASADGVVDQQTTFATLGLTPVPSDAVEEIPPFPDDALDPESLVTAAGDVVRDCLGGRPNTVVYATGAPFAWDGTRWTERPVWTARLTADDSAAVLDAVTGDGASCVD